MADLEDVTLDGRPLQSLRVADLKAALEERGLPKSGQKNALVKRLKGALMLENLQRTSQHHIGLQPNSQIGEEMSQNSFIKQYLAKQQELLRQRLEKEAREAVEEDDTDQEDHAQANNSSACADPDQAVSPVFVDQHQPLGHNEVEGLAGRASEDEGHRSSLVAPASHTVAPVPMASLSVRGSGSKPRPGRVPTSSQVPADSDDDSDGGDDDGEDEDWDNAAGRRRLGEPPRGQLERERSGGSRQPPQHIPPLLSPQLRQPTPPPSPPPELSFPLPDTPKQSPPSPGEPPARQRSSSTSSSGSSSSSRRSSSPEPQSNTERKPGPLTLLARKMASEGAFSGVGWHGCGEVERKDNNVATATVFPGRGSHEGIVSAITNTANAATSLPFPNLALATELGDLGGQLPQGQRPVSVLRPTVMDERGATWQQEIKERELQAENERVRALEKERLEAEMRKALLEQQHAVEEARKIASEREREEKAKALEEETRERERALEQERLSVLEQEREENEKALAKDREEREKAMALERQRALEEEVLHREREEKQRAIEKQRAEALEREERERALELKRVETEKALEKERQEREKALELERLEREQREKALELVQLEKEQREKALELERLAKEKALEEARVEREKALEREQVEREKALAREREQALERERQEREALELEQLAKEKALEESLEREKALAREREQALERERQEREAFELEQLAKEKALEESLEREKALAREREQALERERQQREALELERLAKEKALEESLEREKALAREQVEREKALTIEREQALERERQRSEKILELERLEKEQALEREQALEKERVQALKLQKLEREKALEQEREEREKSLEQERREREKAGARAGGESFGARAGGEGESFGARAGGEGGSFGARAGGEGESFGARAGGEGESFGARAGGEGESFGARAGGEGESFGARAGGEGESFGARAGGEGESFGARAGGEEKALEQERVEREKALEQEREQALECERREREKALELEHLEKEKALEQERKQAIERERVEKQKALEFQRLAKEKELEREMEKALERERQEREKALELERLEKEKALEQECVEKGKVLEQIEEKAIDKERLERGKTLALERLQTEREQVLEAEGERAKLAERESHLPPWKRGREIGLTSVPTPPLSTGADRMATTEEGGELHGPSLPQTAPTDSRPAESGTPLSQTLAMPLSPQSFKKFRFLRGPPISSPSSSASLVLKKPCTFSDSPHPQTSAVQSPSKPKEQQAGSSQDSQPSAGKETPQVPKSLASDEHVQADKEEMHKLAVGKTAREAKGLDSLKQPSATPVLPLSLPPEEKSKVDKRQKRQMKKENRGRRASSCSDSSSPDSDFGSSSSCSSGISSSSPGQACTTTGGRRPEKPQTSNICQDTQKVGQLQDSTEAPKVSGDNEKEDSSLDGARHTKKPSFGIPARQDNEQKEARVGEEEKRHTTRQVKEAGLRETDGAPGSSEETLTPKAFTARRISLSSSKASPGAVSAEGEAESGTGRKRRWGSSTAVTAKKPSISITTDSLKSLIPDIRACPGQEALVDLHPEEAPLSGAEEEDGREHGEQDLKIRRTVTQVVPSESQQNGQEESPSEQEEQRQDGGVVKSDREEKVDLLFQGDSMEMQPTSPPSRDADPSTVAPSDALVLRSVSQQRTAVSFTIDDPVRTAKQPSPPMGKISNIVHISNLVRPFTLGQLKELLSRTGTVLDEGFWIDKIKSHCYVTYGSADEAMATRAALHGVKWPQSNPKFLCVDFSKQVELDIHKGLLLPERAGGDERGATAIPRRGHGAALPPLLPERDQRAEREREMERRERTRAEREWDRDKVRDFGPGKPGEEAGPRRSRSRERKRKEIGKSKDRKADKRDKAAEEPPAKMLDDLFNKTKAVPCIYWLPLTDEQFAQREAARQDRMKEREKRRKELQEEEDKKREEDRKERMKASSGPAGDRGEGDRDRGRGEGDKRREGLPQTRGHQLRSRTTLPEPQRPPNS
ncbi:hypothetical protein UPYG_G00293940 [Umbra pygmaea]|uniref:SAP domain-containing protein n=1 Tax=Umbra pygmaea TaxID=75934 RepID=A0ABD0WPW2_UMBPY